MKTWLSLPLLVLLLAGCAGKTAYRDSCAAELNAAWKEQSLAEAEGFAGTVSYSKAMALLTGGQSPGYLPAEQSLEQACQDLLAHMQLSIAQVQQVIEQAQTTLNPQLIADELQHEGGFNLKLASSRKARLWDLYCERYRLLGELWS